MNNSQRFQLSDTPDPVFLRSLIVEELNRTIHIPEVSDYSRLTGLPFSTSTISEI